MSQIITWLIALSALGVSIYSIRKSNAVAKAQLTMPARLRDLALRDEFRKDLAEASLDLKEFARGWERNESPTVPYSVRAIERSGVSRAQRLGDAVAVDLHKCQPPIISIHVQLEIWQSHKERFEWKRADLVNANEHADRSPEEVQGLVDATEDARQRMQTSRSEVVKAAGIAHEALSLVVKNLDLFAATHFPSNPR